MKYILVLASILLGYIIGVKSERIDDINELVRLAEVVMRKSDNEYAEDLYGKLWLIRHNKSEIIKKLMFGWHIKFYKDRK